MRALILFGFLLMAPLIEAAGLSAKTAQIVVSIAPEWNSSTGQLQLFEKKAQEWVPVSSAWDVLYGRNGLAWGIGEHPTPTNAAHPLKCENDKRSPAGIFKIGKIFTYDSTLPKGADFPFHTMSLVDAWIDDPSLPNYNRHVRVDLRNPPAWFEKQRMRLNDPPHRWLIEIQHNAARPIPGAGSAIFFHIQRGPKIPTAGCTVMTEPRIRDLITWLRTDGAPHYVLLPRSEYLSRWKTWGLPSPQAAKQILD
jgi:L,D-peptidoglycan transpeptidase YkuD (ErfK/YbiS/YcfS/YnhG family)